MWNVLYVDYKPIFAGGQIALLSLLREIDKKQVNATVIVPSESPFTEELRKEGIHFEVIDLGEIQKGWEPFLLLRNLTARITPTVKLIHLIRRQGIDIVHANGTFSFIACCFAAKLCRVPVIWWVHNTGLARNGVFLIPFIRLADKIVAVTEAIRREFVGLVRGADSKISTIYNGLDLRRFGNVTRREDKLQELGLLQGSPIIGTVSRLAPEKGLTYFIDAAARVLSAVPQARFLIVGDGPIRRELEVEVSRKSLEDRVTFTGFRGDVLDIISTMDIFVLSAVSREALSMAVLEAMALRKPIVATDIGGNRELVVDGENGFLVPPGDAESLARAIITLSRDEEKRMAMGQIGRRRVEQFFRIEDMVERNLQLYRELAHEDRR